jgi:formate dehydrogenase beta subunit
MAQGTAGAAGLSIPPGSGRRRATAFPKGRALSPRAVEEVRALLADRPRNRDLLIEHLHLIQDRYHCLSLDHLAALAEEMKLSMSEVFEVATFYAHFEVVAESATSTAPQVTIRVCDSLSCMLAGGDALLKSARLAFEGRARVVRAPCIGRCHRAPAALVDQVVVDHADVVELEQSLSRAVAGTASSPTAVHQVLEQYRADGGYQVLAQCRDGRLGIDAVLSTLADSGLRGLGGAGFPTSQKWQFVRQEPGPRLLAVNADEGEPGTFKDGFYLDSAPHQFLEGMLIAAWAIEARRAYIYLRDEYPNSRRVLSAEIAGLERAGLIEPGFVELRRGAGAYICGEETAMLESLEGKRGLPRHKPPFPTQVGLYGRPTLINNVETLYWVPEILRRGAGWFTSHGRNGRKGLRTFSVSGRVGSPGVKLAPAGISARQLIDEYCGGMAEGHEFLAYLPGGASGGILPANMADLPLDFGTLEPHGCFIGSAAVIVLSKSDDLRAVALNLMRFFEDESCGQCTPCRVGTEKAVKLMESRQWDLPLLNDLSTVMRDASICGLGQAAPNPLLCLFRYFPEVFT